MQALPNASGLLLCDADDARDGAVIRNVGLAPDAPVVVVGSLWPVKRPVALVAIAQAAATRALAAAVVVGHDVLLAVAGVPTGADPGDRRWLGSRRTGGYRTAAAGAQEAVDRTVAPVFTGGGIALLLHDRLATCDRQEWQACRTHKESAEPSQHAAT